VPIARRCRQVGAADDLIVPEIPDQVLAAVVLPQDVAGTVVIEVADRNEMPVARRRRQVGAPADLVAADVPDQILTARILP
jgi:hypothetical protein